MLRLLQELEQEIISREQVFQTELENLGNISLVSKYSDIILLKRSLNILTKSAVEDKQSLEHPKLPSNSIEIASNQTENNMMYKGLTDAVRKAVKPLNDDNFTTNEIFNKLLETYPNNISKSDKPSVSATLTNLTKSGEIERITKGGVGKPNIYRNKPV